MRCCHTRIGHKHQNGGVCLLERKDEQGGTLLVSLLICLILGILLGSYLSLVQNQHLSVTRAEAWNYALIVAEAGIEDALAHLNSGVTPTTWA